MKVFLPPRPSLPASPRPRVPASLADAVVSEDLLAELIFGGERLRILQQQRRALIEHMAEYRSAQVAKGNGSKYVRDTMRRLRVMVRLCRAKAWSDLSTHAIRQALPKTMAERPRRKSNGPATANHYFTSLKIFCSWMTANDRAERSPCRAIRPFNVALDVRHPRRALSHVEALRLIEAAHRGRAIGRPKISGLERALGYVLVLTTGLRSNELQTLTSAVFRLTGPDKHVVVQAAYSKGKRRQIVPLRSDVAELVRAYLEQAGRTEQLFRRPKNAIRALKEDLAAAGIAYCQGGEYADFHALRHTFVSNLFESGATPKEAQSLARHQDARLTLGRYAHVTADQQRSAVERLPALTPPRTAVPQGPQEASPPDERTPNHAITLAGRADPARL